MTQPHVAKWFHKFGWLNWYRNEWVRFEFEAFGREFGIIWLRQVNQVIWVFGAKIVSRSDFERPSCLQGGLKIVL